VAPLLLPKWGDRRSQLAGKVTRKWNTALLIVSSCERERREREKERGREREREKEERERGEDNVKRGLFFEHKYWEILSLSLSLSPFPFSPSLSFSLFPYFYSLSHSPPISLSHTHTFSLLLSLSLIFGQVRQCVATLKKFWLQRNRFCQTSWRLRLQPTILATDARGRVGVGGVGVGTKIHLIHENRQKCYKTVFLCYRLSGQLS